MRSFTRFSFIYPHLSIMFLLMVVASASPFEEPTVPAVYVFGDSTADVGTNNYLLYSQAKADFPYNGIDYPYSVATGRFSNGLNSADQIVRLLGYKRSPPPYFALQSEPSTFKRNILRGVNFASAGAGILYQTGFDLYKDVVPMDLQIEQFKSVVGNLTYTDILSEALFVILIGSNDIFDHYRFNRTTISKTDFMLNIQATFHNQLKSLYDLGGRRFGVVGVPPIGCCPYARAMNNGNSSDGCLEELNDYAQTFHEITKVILQTLSSEVDGMKYSLGNAYAMTRDFMEDPLAFGFTDITNACCGSGKYNGEGACFAYYSPSLCGNRRNHLFWDLYHPTEAAYELAALTLYGGGLQYVTPMNFSQLAVVNLTKHDG